MPVDAPIGPRRIQRGLITMASGDLQTSTTLWAVRTTSGTVQDVAWEISEW